jgi:hypothetical protein
MSFTQPNTTSATTVADPKSDKSERTDERSDKSGKKRHHRKRHKRRKPTSANNKEGRPEFDPKTMCWFCQKKREKNQLCTCRRGKKYGHIFAMTGGLQQNRSKKKKHNKKRKSNAFYTQAKEAPSSSIPITTL